MGEEGKCDWPYLQSWAKPHPPDIRGKFEWTGTSTCKRLGKGREKRGCLRHKEQRPPPPPSLEHDPGGGQVAKAEERGVHEGTNKDFVYYIHSRGLLAAEISEKVGRAVWSVEMR